MSTPAVSPVWPIASMIRSSAARLDRRFGAKPPSSPSPVGQALALQHGLERVVDLGAPAQRLGEGRRRRSAAIMNSWTSTLESACAPPLRMFIIGTGSRCAFGAAEVAEQRQVGRVGGGLGDRERDAEDRVGAQLALVRRAVEVDQGLVDEALLAGLEADELGADRVEHRVDGLEHALAAVALAAVAQLDRLEGAGGRAGGTAARARVPSSRATSTSTVGLPRESRISRAPTASMLATDGRAVRSNNPIRRDRTTRIAPPQPLADKVALKAPPRECVASASPAGPA